MQLFLIYLLFLTDLVINTGDRPAIVGVVVRVVSGRLGDDTTGDGGDPLCCYRYYYCLGITSSGVMLGDRTLY